MVCLLPILMVPVSPAALATMALLFSAILDPGSPVTDANAARLKGGVSVIRTSPEAGASKPDSLL